MPHSRGKHVKPVIVEVKPSNVCGSKRTDSGVVTSVSRPLTPTEAWSLWHFETHARLCPECYDPLGVHLKNAQLCGTGHALAQDVAEHVYHHAGEVYSKSTDDYKQVRVELPPGYTQVRGLLQAMDRAVRSTSRTSPIISYDPTYYVSARRRSPSPERRRRRYEDERAEIIVEPTRSKSQRKSSHKPKRYSTVVVDDNVEAGPSRQPEKKPDARRGSLYETDLQRRKKDKGYLIEIREPEQREQDRERKRYRDEQRRKEERRRSQGYNN